MYHCWYKYLVPLSSQTTNCLAPEMFDAGPHVVQIPGKQPKWPDRNSLDQVKLG